MKISLYEVLAKVDNIKNKNEKIEYLRFINNEFRTTFTTLIDYLYNPNKVARWAVSRLINYKPSRQLNLEAAIWSHVKRFYIFYDGGVANLSAHKRDMAFIGLLESVSDKDAELLHKFNFGKAMPFKTITVPLLLEAFPFLEEQFKPDPSLVGYITPRMATKNLGTFVPVKAIDTILEESEILDEKLTEKFDGEDEELDFDVKKVPTELQTKVTTNAVIKKQKVK